MKPAHSYFNKAIHHLSSFVHFGPVYYVCQKTFFKWRLHGNIFDADVTVQASVGS